MPAKIIKYCAQNYLLTNYTVLVIFISGLYFWQHTNKEEMPNVEFPFVRVSANYSGATPEEVEYFITKPIEDALKGLDGIHSIRSTSSSGSCSLFIELEQELADMDTVVSDIRSAVLEVRLPDEVRDEPRIRQFKTGQKAVLDIAVINTNCELLNNRNRYHLQQLGLSLENQLTSLAEVSSISRSGYLKKEMQVNLDPDKLRIYNIPVSTVLNKINSHNIRQPVGSLEDRKESRVTLSASLYNKKELNNLIIQGAFTGQPVRLKQIAAITNAFAKNTSIIKVNGYEAIIFRVTKSGSSGILKAMAKIRQTVNSFRQNSLKNSPVQIVLLDDESRDIRNRLSIITVNGMIGFVLILIMLFIFLDFRSGVWVAMGIPFCFAFTLTIASMMGYTINNITLAAVIIVMGMIVDDAIVVAENITRLRAAGIPFKEAALKGTVQMLLPITASIVTTCIAFIPLLLMGGRWSRMNSFIPPIIFLMLGASLFESVLILPGHMNLSVPRKLQVIFSLGLLPLIEKYYPAQNIKKNNIAEKNTNAEKKHWFMKIEKRYGKIIEWTLHHRKTVFMVFIMLLITAAFIFISKMKFEMFPREESTQVSLSATAPAGTTRLQTAAMALKLEQILKPDLGKNLVGFRTRIARGRRGRAAEENRLSMRIELVPRGKRNKPLKELLQIWEKKMKKIPDFTEVRFMKHWWGSDSGSPIELVILDNNDQTRGKAVQKMFAIMSRDPALINTEIERELTSPEYTLKINHDKLVKLSINPGAVGATLRTILDGRVLYEIPSGDEETDLKVTVQKSAKNRIDKILNLPVENRSSYMVPLKNIVSIKKGETRASISRENFKRTTKIYADLRARMPENPPAGKGSKFGKKNSKNKPEPKASAQLKPTRETKPAPNEELVDKTPLEIAAYYESKIFPKVMSIYPTTTMYFSGEIKDSRESQSEFIFAIWFVFFMIFIVLALLFQSLLKPLIIIITIPFGFISVIGAFYLHGMEVYGFFAVIGCLGLAGVVVNDSIVMLSKLINEFETGTRSCPRLKKIADVAKTRLRAVTLTTLTTVAGLFPTAYGVAGYDSMLAEMMLALGWGLLGGTFITLILVPNIYAVTLIIRYKYFPQSLKQGNKNVQAL